MPSFILVENYLELFGLLCEEQPLVPQFEASCPASTFIFEFCFDAFEAFAFFLPNIVFTSRLFKA